MKLLFILDPLEHLQAYKDTSVAMMRAAQARGHEVYACEQDSLVTGFGPEAAKVSAVATRLRLTRNDDDWVRRGASARRRLREFDAVLMRKDPPFDMGYVTSTWVLEAAERDGACVINSPRAVRDHNEKFALAEFGRFAAPTLVSRAMADVHAFIDRQRDTVVKPLDGMGGTGVFRVRRDDPNRYAIVESVSGCGAKAIMAQRFIPEIVMGDKRVLLIGGKPADYVLARMARPGEARANLAAGGKGVAQKLSRRDREIAESVGPALAARGLLLVGLDVIGEYITEINVTSPTCFREIQDQTGFDVAGMFLDAVEQRIKAGKRKAK